MSVMKGPAGNVPVVERQVISAAGGTGKPLDHDKPERWTRVGNERGMKSASESGN